MEEPLNETTGLQLIESMINKAKNKFNESGTLYLVWGVVILLCSLVQFVGVYFYSNQNIFYVWFLSWGVLIYQFVFLAKKKKSRKVKTYADEILGFVWICFVICLFVLMLILQITRGYEMINPILLVLYAMPTFLSGCILKVKALLYGGIACWLLALSTLFILPTFHILLVSVAVIVAWIIPGLVMRNNFKVINDGR